MKPLIGVTSSMEVDRKNYYVTNANIEAIIQAGGIPVMLPYLADENIDEIVHKIDGLYLTGGYDVDPDYFGEEPHEKLGTIIPERDRFEIALVKKALDLDKPILGVCRGSQIMNIAAGGDMYQDIYAQLDQELLQHSQKAPLDHGSHYVDIQEGSLLFRLTGKHSIRVNSYHHQANRRVPEGFKISGRARDGIVEAVESKKHSFVLGVQWHPEHMVKRGDEAAKRILNGFIQACRNYKTEK